MIAGFAVLLLCQLVGEALARALGLPVPGPVLGMGLLVLALALWEHLPRTRDAADAESPTGRAADSLLGALSLLFVPAGVGVVQHLGLIGANGFAITVTLVVSNVLTLLVTVLTFVGVKRLFRLEDPRP